jgi:hypothetical protein
VPPRFIILKLGALAHQQVAGAMPMMKAIRAMLAEMGRVAAQGLKGFATLRAKIRNSS